MFDIIISYIISLHIQFDNKMNGENIKLTQLDNPGRLDSRPRKPGPRDPVGPSLMVFLVSRKPPTL